MLGHINTFTLATLMCSYIIDLMSSHKSTKREKEKEHSHIKAPTKRGKWGPVIIAILFEHSEAQITLHLSAS